MTTKDQLPSLSPEEIEALREEHAAHFGDLAHRGLIIGADVEDERFARSVESAINAKWTEMLSAQALAQQAQEPVAWVNRANLASASVTRSRGNHGDTHTWSEVRTDYHTEPLYTTPQAPQVPAPVDEREAFEAWARSAGNDSMDLERGYRDSYKWGKQQAMWDTWQARAALQSPAPQATKGGE